MGYFAELLDLGDSTQIDPGARMALNQRYGFEADPTSVPGLVERFGLRFPGEPVL